VVLYKSEISSSCVNFDHEMVENLRTENYKFVKDEMHTFKVRKGVVLCDFWVVDQLWCLLNNIR
jgi:hypothetical protein